MEGGLRQDSQQKLIEYLEQLACVETIVEDQAAQWIGQFENLYFCDGKQVFRHSYAEISRFLFEKADDATDLTDILCDNLRLLLQHCGEKPAVEAVFQKLIDHISLENLRLAQIRFIDSQIADIDSYKRETGELQKRFMEIDSEIKESEQRLFQSKSEMENLRTEAQEHSKQVEKLLKDVENAKVEVENLQKDVQSHNTQAVTVLSIFSGIVFTFSGGITLLGNLFPSLASVAEIRTVYLLGAAACLCAVVLYDIIYMLLSYTNRLCSSESASQKGITAAVNIVGVVFAFLLFNLFMQEAGKESYILGTMTDLFP